MPADDFDALLDEFGPGPYGTDEWAEEFERWCRWRDAARAGEPVKPSLNVPGWHDRRYDDRPMFGVFGDHEWAVTRRADPKYL